MSRLLFPDNTVLINFAYIGRMDLLERLTNGNGAWCQSVAFECAKSSEVDGLAELTKAPSIFGEPWVPESGADHLEIRRLRTEMASPGEGRSKHLGEAETIVLMERRCPDGKFVTDDVDAARKAKLRGIDTFSTWDLMLLALRLRWVDADTVFGYAKVLQMRGQYVPRNLVYRQSFNEWLHRNGASSDQ